jgi:hypothetical protein
LQLLDEAKRLRPEAKFDDLTHSIRAIVLTALGSQYKQEVMAIIDTLLDTDDDDASTASYSPPLMATPEPDPLDPTSAQPPTDSQLCQGPLPDAQDPGGDAYTRAYGDAPTVTAVDAPTATAVDAPTATAATSVVALAPTAAATSVVALAPTAAATAVKAPRCDLPPALMRLSKGKSAFM